MHNFSWIFVIFSWSILHSGLNSQIPRRVYHGKSLFPQWLSAWTFGQLVEKDNISQLLVAA